MTLTQPTFHRSALASTPAPRTGTCTLHPELIALGLKTHLAGQYLSFGRYQPLAYRRTTEEFEIWFQGQWQKAIEADFIIHSTEVPNE